uniref:Uncharacterized protein n=1 Tax=Myotis myotis TaxID=51298 RepID=A0A7J8AM13_MYOMY|nr:hypothetical protein mMyoMyo1_007794 [Myotis myotis]
MSVTAMRRVRDPLHPALHTPPSVRPVLPSSPTSPLTALPPTPTAHRALVPPSPPDRPSDWNWTAVVGCCPRMKPPGVAPCERWAPPAGRGGEQPGAPSGSVELLAGDSEEQQPPLWPWATTQHRNTGPNARHVVLPRPQATPCPAGSLNGRRQVSSVSPGHPGKTGVGAGVQPLRSRGPQR